MNGKIGSGFALAWLATLGLIVAGFIGLNAWMGKPAAAVPATVPRITSSQPVAVLPARDEPSAPAPPPTPVPMAVSVPVTTTLSNQPVTVLDLDQLASAVHLREPSLGASKQVWASQLPIAESLLQRPCDCDQRNWLKHYVKTANDALAGSEDYVHSVQLLATLRRSDQDLSTTSPTPR